ncbi:MAG: aminotransferase, partial [Candidatus Aminicenantes bacterium]
YWAKRLEKLKGVRILTSYSPEQSCGIGTFTVDHIDVSRLTQVLFEKHKIYSISVGVPENTVGIRVTPSVYTTLRELDIFVEAVEHYITNGLPD